jgi:hypothetical protein
MFKDFKEFAMRGNVVDLAIGVIIGAAFGKDHRLARRRHHNADHRRDYRRSRFFQSFSGSFEGGQFTRTRHMKTYMENSDNTVCGNDASRAPHFTRNAARMDAMKPLTLGDIILDMPQQTANPSIAELTLRFRAIMICQ